MLRWLKTSNPTNHGDTNHGAYLPLEQIDRFAPETIISLSEPLDPKHLNTAILSLISCKEESPVGKDTLTRIEACVKAHPSCLTPRGIPPLHIAAMYGLTGVIKILLDNNANIEEEFQRSTALLLAAKHGQTKTVSLLLEHGADINKQLGKDNILHLAMSATYEENAIDVIKAIIKKGKLDKNLLDANGKEGKTPILLAASKNWQDLGRLLLEYEQKPKPTSEKLVVNEQHTISPTTPIGDLISFD